MTEIGDRPDVDEAFEAPDDTIDLTKFAPTEAELCDRARGFLLDPDHETVLTGTESLTKYDHQGLPALQLQIRENEAGETGLIARYHYEASPTVRGERAYMLDLDHKTVANVTDGDLKPMKDTDRFLLEAMQHELFSDNGKEADGKRRLSQKVQNKLTRLAKRYG